MKLKEPPGTCCTAMMVSRATITTTAMHYGWTETLAVSTSSVPCVLAACVSRGRIAGLQFVWVGRKQNLDDALPQLQVLINACRSLQALAAGGTARRVYAPVRRTRYIDRNRSLYYLCTLISGGYRCTPNAAGGGTVLEWHDRDTGIKAGHSPKPRSQRYMRCRGLLPARNSVTIVVRLWGFFKSTRNPAAEHVEMQCKRVGHRFSTTSHNVQLLSETTRQRRSAVAISNGCQRDREIC